MKGSILLFFGLIFFFCMMRGQTAPELNVAVDTTKMRIGEQINYTLQIKADYCKGYLSRTSPVCSI